MKSFGKSLVTAIQKIDSICSQGNLQNPTKKIHVVSRNTSLSNAVQLRKKRYLQKTKNLRTIHKVLSENLENYQRNSSWENLRTYLTVSKEIDNLDSVDYLDKPQVSNSCINTETGKLNKKEFNVEKYTKSPYSKISLAKVMSSNETRKEPNSSQIPFTVLSKVKIVDSHNISGDIKKRVKYRGQNLDENNIHLNNSKTEFKNSSKSSIRSTRSGLKPVKDVVRGKDHIKQIFKSSTNLDVNKHSITSITRESGKDTGENLKYAKPSDLKINKMRSKKYQNFVHLKDGIKNDLKASTNLGINRTSRTSIRPDLESKNEELESKKGTREMLDCDKISNFKVNKIESKYKNTIYPKDDYEKIIKSTVDLEKNTKSNTSISPEYLAKKGLEPGKYTRENLKYTNFGISETTTNKDKYFARSKDDNKKIHKSSTNVEMDRNLSIFIKSERRSKKEELKPEKDTRENIKYTKLTSFDINRTQTNPYKNSTYSKNDNKQIHKSTTNVEMNRITRIPVKLEFHSKKEEFETEKENLKYTGLSNFKMNKMETNKYNNSAYSKYDNKKIHKSSTNLDMNRVNSISVRPELGTNKELELELNRNSSISIRPGVFSRKKELKLAKNSENIRHFKESGKNFANSKDDKFFYKSITNIDINRNSSPSIRKELSLIKEELESEKDIGENYKYAKTSNIKKRSNKCHTKDDIKNFFKSCTNLETYIKPKLYSTKKKLVEDNSEELRQAKVSNFDKNKTESNNNNDFTLKNIHKPSTNVKIANSTNYINQNTERQLKDEQKIVPQSEKIYLESNFPKTGCRLAYEMAIAEVNNNIEQDLSSNNLTWTKQKIIAKMQNLNKESHYENVARKWNNPQNLQQNLPLNPKLQSTPKLINIKKNKSVKESSNLQSPVVINNFLTLFNKVKHSKSNMKYQVVLSCAQPTVKINEPLISDNKEAAQSKRTTILELMLKHKKEKDCFTPGYSLKYKLSSKFHNNQTNGQFFKRDSTERLKENPMIGSKTRNEGFNFYRPIKSSSVLEHILSKKDPRVYSSASDC
ncbi:uncharacterized protein MAL13P1.304-like [Diorhabda carinulata]|uniref:uncharacterized protein MAL13P1.304-like n=1 Tax=Diorhabda carinulata TaxID=1163345 RepID=UPI0025A0819F|nr:uncharacterized protein MAL13P1.304-like [Diorhabda carinulata]